MQAAASCAQGVSPLPHPIGNETSPGGMPTSARAWNASGSSMPARTWACHPIRRRPRRAEDALIGPPEVADDGPLELERVELAGLAIEDLPAGGDDQRIGDRARPLAVERLGELVAVGRAQDVIGRRDVVLLEDPQRLVAF